MGNVHFYNEGSGGGNFNGTITAEKVLVDQTTGLEPNAQLEFQKQRELLDDLHLRSEIGECLDYGYFTLSTPQKINLNGTKHVEFDTKQGNIECSIGTGQELGKIKLKKGKTYHIQGSASIAFTTAIHSHTMIGLYDITNNKTLASYSFETGNGANEGGRVAQCIITPQIDIQVVFRQPPTYVKLINSAYIIVQEIARNLIKDPVQEVLNHEVSYGLFSKRSQSNVSNGLFVELEKVIGNVECSIGTGQENGAIKVRGGKIYQAIFSGIGLALSSRLNYQLIDITNNVILGESKGVAVNYGGTHVSQDGSQCQFKTVNDIDIRIKVLGGASIIEKFELVIQEIAQLMVVEYTKELNNPLSTKPLEYGTFHIPSPQVANLRTGNHVELEHLNGNIRCSKGIGQDKGIIALKGGITYELSSSFRMLGRNATLYLKNITTNELIYEMNGLGGAYQDYTTSNSFNGAYTPLEDCFIELNILAAEGISNLTTVLLFIKEIRNQGVNQYGGFETQILFEGNAGTAGEYSLTDSIANYNFLIVYSDCDDAYAHLNMQSDQTIIDCTDNLISLLYRHMNSKYFCPDATRTIGYSIYYSFINMKKLKIDSIYTRERVACRITKVIGIKGQLSSLLCGGEF